MTGFELGNAKSRLSNRLREGARRGLLVAALAVTGMFAAGTPAGAAPPAATPEKGAAPTAADKPSGATTSSVEPAAAAASPTTDAVIAKVGSRAVYASDLSRALAGIPRFRLRELGATPAEIRRRVLEETVLPGVLFEEEARARGLAEAPAVREHILAVVRDTVVGQLRAETSAEGAVTDAEIKAYYDEHAAQFNAPERLQLWRILLPTREAAAALIASLEPNLTVERWDAAAREQSTDKATRMRRGDLGFVQPDGATNFPQLVVDPALFAAAKGVKNGKLVAAPVAEGEGFAVVWRRGALPAVHRPLAQDTQVIRQLIARKRLVERHAALLAELRQANVSALNEALLESVVFPAAPTLTEATGGHDGELPARVTEPATPPSPDARPAPPERDARGLR